MKENQHTEFDYFPVNEDLLLDTWKDIIGKSNSGGQIGGQIDLTERQQTVLDLIKDDPKISRNVLAEKLGINPSAVQSHLEALKRRDLISRVGGTRGYWKILI